MNEAVRRSCTSDTHQERREEEEEEEEEEKEEEEEEEEEEEIIAMVVPKWLFFPSPPSPTATADLGNSTAEHTK